nr:trypsin-like peptidase domain-containing protein [uncultured Actinoplanes sp.]
MPPAAPEDSWAVAIHVGATSKEAPIGAGVVVEDRLVLACAHVVCHDGQLRDDLWISFPKASGVSYWDRRRIARCVHNGQTDKNVDLVLLELERYVPHSVSPARLRCPPAQDLVNKTWWAYGFPHQVEGGLQAHGRVRAQGGYGRIYLVPDADTEVVRGFSGAALWCPEYEAVVGVVVEAEQQSGDGHALTLAHADEQLPEMKLSALAAWSIGDADDATLAAWGWTLATDDESRRHWMPRARGVAVNSERGARFRGRRAALRRIVGWLDRAEPAGHPLVVTGSPGVGKSAVLGRVVTTADPDIAVRLPVDDRAERASTGSVHCAVHVKGKSALEVTSEIARAAGAALPRTPVDLVPALRDRLSMTQRRFNLVVDALDEAAEPEHARALITDVLVPLARAGKQLDVQLVVGTRRSDGAQDLLSAFGSDAEIIDLDDPEYFAEADLADYAQATLQLTGAERLGNPYADDAIAAPVSQRIAQLAKGNFLVAGLVARARAMRDTEPIAPDRVVFTATVAHALDTYVQGLPPAGAAPARLALTALAFAETPGLPISLWCAATEALGGGCGEEELTRFARTSAANFLVETGSVTDPTYRLFHQALNDALLAARDELGTRSTDERRLTETWIAAGRARGWDTAAEYLLRSLASHAARVGLIDDLLDDDEYLLHAHLDRLMPAANAAVRASARSRALLLQRTPMALNADAPTRAALFSVVGEIDQLGSVVSTARAPYYARWASTPRRPERTVLEGHSQTVYDVCAITVDGRQLLASAGEDGTVRLWDSLTNQNAQVLNCHDDCIRSVCAVTVGNNSLLATASHDGTIGLWDPVTGMRVHELTGHTDWVRNLCAVPTVAGELLASASDDRTVRLWDPTTGTLRHTLTGHRGWVTAVTYVPTPGRGILASTGVDGTIFLWEPESGAELTRLSTQAGWITTLYATRLGDRTILASAGYDGVVRLWDPMTGALIDRYQTDGPLTDLCTLAEDDTTTLVSTGEDGVIRLWDLFTGRHRELQGHSNWIRAVCELPTSDRRLIATAGDDGTVRLWDPDGPSSGPILSGGGSGTAVAVCGVPTADETLVASAGGDGLVRLWEVTSGGKRGDPLTTNGTVNDLCVVHDERWYLAAANEGGFVDLWDVASWEPARRMTEHFDAVHAVRAIGTEDGPILASAGNDVTVRLWTPHNAAIRGGLVGHGNWVTALAVVAQDGHDMLASGDKSGTVRLWDTRSGLLWHQPSHHDAVNALCTVLVGGRRVLASAGADRNIGLWSCLDGRRLNVLTGHSAEVTGVCAVRVGERELVASTSLDRTIRLWDPRTGRAVRTIPVYHQALCCAWVDQTLVVGLDQGMIALTLRR